MFLTQDDIRVLTGYKVPKCQIRWLRDNGFKFLVAGDGKPRVLISYVESVMGGKVSQIKRRT